MPNKRRQFEHFSQHRAVYSADARDSVAD